MSLSHAQRKRDHLRICSEENVAGVLSTGLDQYRLQHCALPELDLQQVDLGARFLGKTLKAPLLVSAMTGGTGKARLINRHLGQAAQSLGLAMCVGSQRAAIENPRQSATYDVRCVAPDVLLLANLGAVQLNYGYGLRECLRAVEMIAADALVLHLNPLQEALQPRGNTDFRGLLNKIEIICRAVKVPVVVKEVGWGISEAVARQLAQAGVAALDVAGAGGSSWSQVESRRAANTVLMRVAESFAGWGITTADAIRQARRGAPSLPIVASGGVRTGPQAAVALALGADMVGLAQPLLPPAMLSAQAVTDELRVVIEGLRIAMFAAGLADIASVKSAGLVPRQGEG